MHWCGNHRICKVPAAAALWGISNPERYRRALDRINRRGAARKAELDALRYSNVATMPDDETDTPQTCLPFPLG